MTQAREPDDIDRVNRELRHFNRRLDRLEYTQISHQEFSSGLDRIYEEIGRTRSEMRAEFVAVNPAFLTNSSVSIARSYTYKSLERSNYRILK